MVKILKQKNVFKGNVIRVDEYDLDFGKNKKATYELVSFSSVTGVSALPKTHDGKFVLIKHFQLGIKDVGWSLPTGGLFKGEDPKERMQLEIQEEIGYKAKKLTLMMRLQPIPSYIGSEPAYIYVAEDLVESKLEGDEMFEIEVIKISENEVLEKIRNGEIQDARTCLAILYYAQFFKDK